MSSMMMPDTQERDPAAIEAEIARRRASLDRKLEEIEQRLIRNPQQRWIEVRERIENFPFAAWGAVAAVVAGSCMAVSGLRRVRTRNGDGADDLAFDDDLPWNPTVEVVAEIPVTGAGERSC